MNVAERIERLEETVYGNGQPGLKTIVHSLDEWRRSVQLAQNQWVQVFAGPLVMLVAQTLLLWYLGVL